MDEAEENIALPKMIFATKILYKEEPYSNVDFSSFVKVFEIVKTIINLPMI